MLSRTRNRLAILSAVVLGTGALALGPGIYGAEMASAHHHHHHHHHHHGIQQHNGGDHDADNNGGPSDGDGNI